MRLAVYPEHLFTTKGTKGRKGDRLIISFAPFVPFVVNKDLPATTEESHEIVRWSMRAKISKIE